MIIVLDSNEYIFYLRNELLFLNKIFQKNYIQIYINEIITKEVLRSINNQQKKEFYSLLLTHNFILFEGKLPLFMYDKYKKKGFKKGDILIASVCDHIKAQYLVSENPHFLKYKTIGDIKIKSVEEFCQIT